MSGHETIRVLEVEVDTPQSSTPPDGKGVLKAEERVVRAAEQHEGSTARDGLTVPQTTGGVGKSFHIFIQMKQWCSC